MNNSPRRFTKLSLLMAAYNEEGTLRRCAERILAAPLPDSLTRELVLVDDGSTDATWEIAQRLATGHPEIRIFQQPRNMGKGAAVCRAIKEMTGDMPSFKMRTWNTIRGTMADCSSRSWKAKIRKIREDKGVEPERLLTRPSGRPDT